MNEEGSFVTTDLFVDPIDASPPFPSCVTFNQLYVPHSCGGMSTQGTFNFINPDATFASVKCFFSSAYTVQHTNTGARRATPSFPLNFKEPGGWRIEENEEGSGIVSVTIIYPSYPLNNID